MAEEPVKENPFTPLTNELYQLFSSCQESGFDQHQAFELTKTYCSVAFANHSVRVMLDYHDRMGKYRRRSNDL